MKKINRVGADVSANTITVAFDQDGIRSEAIDLPSDPIGHRELLRLITRKGFQARIVLEATGN